MKFVFGSGRWTYDNVSYEKIVWCKVIKVWTLLVLTCGSEKVDHHSGYLSVSFSEAIITPTTSNILKKQILERLPQTIFVLLSKTWWYEGRNNLNYSSRETSTFVYRVKRKNCVPSKKKLDLILKWCFSGRLWINIIFYLLRKATFIWEKKVANFICSSLEGLLHTSPKLEQIKGIFFAHVRAAQCEQKVILSWAKVWQLIKGRLEQNRNT